MTKTKRTCCNDPTDRNVPVMESRRKNAERFHKTHLECDGTCTKQCGESFHGVFCFGFYGHDKDGHWGWDGDTYVTWEGHKGCGPKRKGKR